MSIEKAQCKSRHGDIFSPVRCAVYNSVKVKREFQRRKNKTKLELIVEREEEIGVLQLNFVSYVRKWISVAFSHLFVQWFSVRHAQPPYRWTAHRKHRWAWAIRYRAMHQRLPKICDARSPDIIMNRHRNFISKQVFGLIALWMSVLCVMERKLNWNHISHRPSDTDENEHSPLSFKYLLLYFWIEVVCCC